MRVVAVRLGKLESQVRAEDVVVAVVAAERRDAARPRQVAPQPGTDVVGVVAVERRAAGPVVAVEVLAVARRGPEGEAPDALLPTQRCQRRRGVLPLLGVVGRIEAVRAEGAVLVTGLEVEQPGPSGLEGASYIGVVGVEIGVVAVAVAAAVGSRPEERHAAVGNAAREVGVGVAVLSAASFEAEVARPQRRRADIDRAGIGADSRYAVDQIDARNAIEIDRKRMRLVSRARIREVDPVEQYHGLVE